jgi:hypothetical protein
MGASGADVGLCVRAGLLRTQPFRRLRAFFRGFNQTNTMPANPPYLPSRDVDLAPWAINFDALLTANPTNYGLIAGDAVAVAAVVATFVSALSVATDPGTRTPVTIASKDAAKASMLAVVRPYAVRIARNQSVSDGLKTGIGVTVAVLTRTPVPSPASGAELTLVSAIPGVLRLQYQNPDTPGSKAAPYGSSGVELWGKYGSAYTADPSEASYLGRYGKSPVALVTSGQSGMHLSLFGRFVNKGGLQGQALVGPFGTPLQTIVI